MFLWVRFQKLIEDGNFITLKLCLYVTKVEVFTKKPTLGIRV